MAARDIFQAIRLGEVDSFEDWILRCGINQTNEFKQNALHECIAYKRPALARKLIELGINLDQQDQQRQTPLHFAAAHGDLETAKVLVERGADISLSDEYGNQPLWTAVFNARGQYDFVALLTKAGGDPNYKNKSNRTPLDLARGIKDETLINMLSTGSS